LPHTTVEWLYDDLGQVRCHATRSLTDKMDNSQHAQPHRYELTDTPDTRPSRLPSYLLIFQTYPISILKALTHFESTHTFLKHSFRPKQGSIIAIKGGYPTMFLQ
jgi:hypothetical protein